MEDVKGKCCVITGGAGVIGCSMVECLARAGLKTAIIDLNIEHAIQKANEIATSTGGTVIGVGGNVLEKNSLAEAKKIVNDRFGPIDILINAAGGNSPKAISAASSCCGLLPCPPARCSKAARSAFLTDSLQRVVNHQQAFFLERRDWRAAYNRSPGRRPAAGG